MNLQRIFLLVAVAVSPFALAAAQPANSAKSIHNLVAQLEKDGYGPFTQISFDDGYWEVEVYQKDIPYELAVDPDTGKILSQHRDDAERRPPLDARPLSQLLRDLDKAGYTRIHEVSFERRYWEIEVLRDDGKHEMHVDPKTGEIINDRLDD